MSAKPTPRHTGAGRYPLTTGAGRYPLATGARPYSLALLLLLLTSITQAQTAAPLRNTPAAPANAASAAVSSVTSNAKFTLNEVRFSPTHAVSNATLQALVKPFLKREIDATELTVIATAIRRLYEERGFGMAGVGFPGQDLSKGVLQIAIVEPQIERITIEAGPQPPISQARTAAVLQGAGVHSGQALDMQALDRAMFTLNDWPGVAAKATLTPTGDEGKYRVSVQTERRRGWDASIDADNHGTSAAGRYRFGALLRWNNPQGIGDNLDLRMLASNGAGTTVGRLGYELPLGATPWRAGIGYSRVGYSLGEQFAAIDANGTADVIDASLSYPLLRGRDSNLVARLGASSKKLTDEFDSGLGPQVTHKAIRAAELSLSFESRSSWGGGGFNGGTVGMQVGKLSGGVDTGTPSKFSKLNLQYTRLQALTRKLSVFVGTAGQLASNNLDNAEKFTLGGDKGVRAYPSAEGSSDAGLLINTELRYWIDPRWSSYLFFDAGHGRLVKSLSDAGGNTRNLRAAGLGVQYTNPAMLTLKASVAARGSELIVTEDDARTRLLVQIQHSF